MGEDARGRRLRAWLRQLFSVRVDEHVGSFEDHARALTLDYFRIGLALFAASAILWWPTDLFLLDAEARRVFAMSRPTTTSIALVSLAAVHWLRTHRRWTLPVTTLVAFALCAAAGAFKGMLGGLDTIYFHYSYLLPFTGVLVVAPLAKRVLVTAVISAGYPTGFLAVNPSELGHPMLGSALAYLAFGVVLAAGIGHGVYRLFRENFQQRSTLELRIDERTAVLRRLTAYLEESREQERRRVSRELHDETAQLLTGMRIELALLREESGRRATHRSALERLETLIDESFSAHRAIIRSLRPRVLEELGLVPALRQYVDRLARRDEATLEVDLDDTLPALDERTALAAFRAVQELTTNAIRHADASRLEVRVRGEGDRLLVQVTDDGRGFDPDAVDGGFGLLGLRERVQGLGGAIRIDAAPGRGCRATVLLPIADASDAAAQ